MNFLAIFILCSLAWFLVLPQEPLDTFGVSNECENEHGKPQMCHPPFTSAAADRTVRATNTCGVKRRQKYCIHMSTIGMASRCQHCDARNHMERHDAEFMTDKNPNNWWQSETMADNPMLHFNESVNLTIDLGTQFHVNYVYLQFRSPRPHAMVIYKRFDDASDWVPWAYFSSNCYTYFGMSYDRQPDFNQNQLVTCREDYSTLQPLYGGEMIFSVINGRPGYDQFFTNGELQRWSTASQIQIELKKMHTFGDERGAERDTLLTYYFAIQKLTVGGRCLCHGHGNECRPSPGPGQRDRLVCVCATSHHTTGDNCELCTPDHRDVPWQPATPTNANPCKPCNCNGNSQLCEFDPELYQTTGSGSRCIGCGNNTEGINCERCKTGYYADQNMPTVCRPCACDPTGTTDGLLMCGIDGQCQCKPGIGGKRCDRCLDDHFGFSAGGCQRCNCSTIGSYENRPKCDAVTGHCECKQNVAGQHCDRCKLGHYGLLSNDPLGCKPCVCSRHSSECDLDNNVMIASSGTVSTNGLVEADKVIINCPENLLPCFACLQKDRQHISVGCDGTVEGFLPCLCVEDQNRCPYCPNGWKTPQPDPRQEQCTCPPQYIGKSCERCAIGHRRDPPGSEVTNRCIPCTCNNHSSVCHPETGQCECKDNTGGLFCDQCADGYYGNAFALAGSFDVCKPCPCPAGSKCEQTNWLDRSIKVVCKDCPDNRTGIRCERCAENFFGDPERGVACKPCDCSNNIDPRDFGNCDSKTGVCLKCLFGTTGDQCEQCIAGYRRNYKPAENETTDTAMTRLVPARGCSPCNCDPVGTLASYGASGVVVCNPESGQCPCKPGVGGLQCKECYPGFYGFHSGQGCRPCDCNSIGATGEACDDQTGRCECRPHVTGRQCDQCLPGYFNMTSTDGCSDCRCHPYGAELNQCDANGQCACRPFAKGEACDQCEENHHNLEAGCLPCPACYNLVQARVAKLRGMLESVFGPLQPGSKPGIGQSQNETQLREEIEKLNSTIVDLYRNVLNIGGSTTIVDGNQLEKTLRKLESQLQLINIDIEVMRLQPSRCSPNEVDKAMADLKIQLSSSLPDLLNEEVAKFMKQLKNTSAGYQSDPLLTNRANEAARLSSRLSNQAKELKGKTVHLNQMLIDVSKNVDESEKKLKDSENLLVEKQKASTKVEIQGAKLVKQIEDSNELAQKISTQIYDGKTKIDKLPDLTEHLRQLEAVADKWDEAKNVSKTLQKRFTEATVEIQSTVDRYRQMNDQLQAILKDRTNQTSNLEPQFKELQEYADRVLTAKNLTWIAVNDSRKKLDMLNDFENYIAKTKTEVASAMDKRSDLEERLEKLELNAKNISDSANDELKAALELQGMMEELGNALKNMQSKLNESDKKYTDSRDKLLNLKSQHDNLVRHEVDKAVEVVNGLENSAVVEFEKVTNTQERVSKLEQESIDLLNRMKTLKSQLTDPSGGGGGGDADSQGNGHDATTRFSTLKKAAKNLHLSERLSVLKKLNDSRTIELNYLRKELGEFRAHLVHLKSVDSLLPNKDLNCFYTGKGIEGGD